MDNALNKPDSREAKLLALAVADSKRYRLSVVSSRQLPKSPARKFDLRGRRKVPECESAVAGRDEWNPNMKTVYSPASPDAFWQEAAEFSACPHPPTPPEMSHRHRPQRG